MLKIPKKINIFGRIHKVSTCKNLFLPNGIMVRGYFESVNAIIKLEEDQTPQEMIQTLLHEMGHALINRISIDQSGMPPEVEEIIVDAYATMISEIFTLKFKKS